MSPPPFRSDVTVVMVVIVMIVAIPPHKMAGFPSPEDPILLDLPWDVPRLPPSPEDPMLLDVPWDVPTGRSVV